MYLTHKYLNDPVFAETVLEYQSSQIPPTQWQKFKNGDFTIEAKLDLHGYTGDEAEYLFINFFKRVIQNNMRYGLIIHGKGGKYHEPPVLKNLVNLWLREMPEILAFYSARNKHGGTGAVYFWLKSQS